MLMLHGHGYVIPFHAQLGVEASNKFTSILVNAPHLLHTSKTYGENSKYFPKNASHRRFAAEFSSHREKEANRFSKEDTFESISGLMKILMSPMSQDSATLAK
jgi:hypothetical protein